ncbi:hypothetical protein [Enterovibrio calviensis]|uniref:hypothetical protein n=1 Tax=Enterovibrio calviensis TaxID=91359 RepID=UPI000483887E|nr:hypothetical protein [Enterovibrio calviensis]
MDIIAYKSNYDPDNTGFEKITLTYNTSPHLAMVTRERNGDEVGEIDYWFISPHIKGKGARSEFGHVLQEHHLTPSNVYKSVEFADYF